MWQWYAVIAMSCFASMQLMFKYLTRQGLTSPAVLVFVFAFGTMFYLAHVRMMRTPTPLSGATLAILVGAAALSYVGNLFSLRAIVHAPNPGYAMAITGLQAVVVTFLSALLFDSSLSWVNLLGVCLCVIGLALVVL